MKKEERIINGMVEEICNRQDLKCAWDSIDDPTHKEIIDAWISIIENNSKKIPVEILLLVMDDLIIRKYLKDTWFAIDIDIQVEIMASFLQHFKQELEEIKV